MYLCVYNKLYRQNKWIFVLIHISLHKEVCTGLHFCKFINERFLRILIITWQKFIYLSQAKIEKKFEKYINNALFQQNLINGPRMLLYSHCAYVPHNDNLNVHSIGFELKYIKRERRDHHLIKQTSSTFLISRLQTGVTEVSKRNLNIQLIEPVYCVCKKKINCAGGKGPCVEIFMFNIFIYWNQIGVAEK